MSNKDYLKFLADIKIIGILMAFTGCTFLTFDCIFNSYAELMLIIHKSVDATSPLYILLEIAVIIYGIHTSIRLGRLFIDCYNIEINILQLKKNIDEFFINEKDKKKNNKGGE